MTKVAQPHPLPAAGGSYLRASDGSLAPVPRPDAPSASKPAPAPAPAPKPAPKAKEI